jgi:hypothetical protein
VSHDHDNTDDNLHDYPCMQCGVEEPWVLGHPALDEDGKRLVYDGEEIDPSQVLCTPCFEQQWPRKAITEGDVRVTLNISGNIGALIIALLSEYYEDEDRNNGEWNADLYWTMFDLCNEMDDAVERSTEVLKQNPTLVNADAAWREIVARVAPEWAAE